MPGTQTLPTLCQLWPTLATPSSSCSLKGVPLSPVCQCPHEQKKTRFTHHLPTPGPPPDPPPVTYLLQWPEESSAPSSQKPPQPETHSPEVSLLQRPRPRPWLRPLEVPGNTGPCCTQAPSTRAPVNTSPKLPSCAVAPVTAGGILGTRHLESCTEFRPQVHPATCWLQFPIPPPTALKVQAASSACRGLCELRFLAHSDGCGHWWLLGSGKLP